jgi:hypothetical protein
MHRSVHYKTVPYSVAFSPHALDDGNHPCLAVGQFDDEIVLCMQDVLGQGEECCEECFHTLEDSETAANSVAFSSSGKQLLAYSSKDYTVLEGHTWEVSSVTFSPDDRLLASASFDCTARLWDVAEQMAVSPVHVLRGHTDWVTSVSFSPDGRQLASSSWDCTVRLWSVPEGVPGPVLKYACLIFRVAFSPVLRSNVLASGCSDGIVRLWDVSGVDQRLLCELQGQFDSVTSMAFSPDGSRLVLGSWKCAVQLWSVSSGKLLKALNITSRYNPGVSCVTCVAFHPNGKQVATCFGDKTVCIWTVCEWSDRDNNLFPSDIRRVVFCLMCVKAWLESKEEEMRCVPCLPMALWLHIMMFVVTECVL